MKAFVIHIPGDKETYKNELESFQIDYEVFPAIVKEQAAEGISESIKAIIRQCYEDESVLIFEDDVKFTSIQSRSTWNQCASGLPDNWDILLGGSYWYDKPKAEYSGILKLGDFSSLHCVLIRKTAYDLILKHDVSDILHMDRYIGKLSAHGNLNTYLCNPQIAIQYNGFSRTRMQEVNYDHLLKDKNILYD